MASRLAVTGLLTLMSTTLALADDSKRLEHMVQQDCGSCHGLTMKGGLGKPLTREALAEVDPQTIASIILDGVPGTAMPPWRPLLGEAEALWIANYLKKGALQ